MALTQPLLTIAVPTYNRSKFLCRALQYIYIQIVDKDYPIEIIVSDNCSIDDTASVIKNYRNKGLEIRYIKNAENKGPDFNILQCYAEAKGKYVMALGDDDILIDGSIKQILQLLAGEEYGVVFLNQRAIEENLPTFSDDKLNYEIYNSSQEFLNRLSYYITFISANIVNKKYFNKAELDRYTGTYLIQVPFITNAILNASQNVCVNSKLLCAEDVENSGGYNVIKIFGENLFQILNEILAGYENLHVLKKIKKDLLTKLLPFWLIKLKEKKGSYETSNSLEIIYNNHKNNINYWILLLPIYKLPLKLARYYQYLSQKLKLIS